MRMERNCDTEEQKVRYMKRAIELALSARGHTSPNPMVGCVVVKEGRIISEACHEKYGEFHAERNALLRCKEDTRGAELYVTLEPCCHYGKTPPCTEIIIEKGISRVYVGSLDSNPLVAGKGIEILQQAGIQVEYGILDEECRKMNEIFYHYISHKTPFVALKYAMTLDGKIAAYTGDSKWVTSEEARYHVQQLRKEYSGILVGIGTVLADNPMLNCRIEEDVNPIRIICDSNLQIPMDSNIVKTAKDIKTIVAYSEAVIPEEAVDRNMASTILSERYRRSACDMQWDKQEKRKKLQESGITLINTGTEPQVNLNVLMKKLGEMKIDSVIIEGGAAINASALQAGIVNKVYAYIAPKIIMGETAKSPVGGRGIEFMKDAVCLKHMQSEMIGKDLLITGYIR